MAYLTTLSGAQTTEHRMIGSLKKQIVEKYTLEYTKVP
jgi:hypothetical protein